MRIKKAPNVLMVHLKRFKYVEQLQRHRKLSHRVVFPFELRIVNMVLPLLVQLPRMCSIHSTAPEHQS
jgi:hypothetical protein